MGHWERGSAVRIIYIFSFRGVNLVVWIWIVVAAAQIPGWSVGAQRLHAVFDKLTDGPLRPVTRTSVQLLTLGDFTHIRDHISAGVRADPVEQLPAVGHVVVHRGAALRVSLALEPRLRAASAGSPGDAGLYGPLGALTHRVVGAAAVLQSRSVFGLVELHERGDAVAGTPSALPAQHGTTCAGVVLVRVIALGLELAVHDGFPAYQPPAVGRRSHRQVPQKQKYTNEKPDRATDAPRQSARARHRSGYKMNSKHGHMENFYTTSMDTVLAGECYLCPARWCVIGPCVQTGSELHKPVNTDPLESCANLPLSIHDRGATQNRNFDEF